MKLKYFRYLFNLMKSYFYDLYFNLFATWKERILADNYSKYLQFKMYPYYLKEGSAMSGIRFLARKYCLGKGVDIGCSKWPLEGARGVEYTPQEDAYKLNEKNESLDFVFSSHLFEHLERPFDAVEEWHRVLKSQGVIFFYLPHPVCKMWLKKNLTCHLWNPDPYVMEEHFKKDKRFNVEYITYQPDGMMSFAVVVRKV